MEAEPHPDDNVPVGSEMAMPGDEPTEDFAEKERRLPIPEFFTRRAFASKDTGRWHRLPRGRDRKQDEPK